MRRAGSAEYPDRPIRLVVPFPPGGPTDVFAPHALRRGLADAARPAGAVENKAGAGGNVGTDLVAKSKPDGYTLLLGTAATHGINISLYEQPRPTIR